MPLVSLYGRKVTKLEIFRHVLLLRLAEPQGIWRSASLGLCHRWLSEHVQRSRLAIHLGRKLCSVPLLHWRDSLTRHLCRAGRVYGPQWAMRECSRLDAAVRCSCANLELHGRWHLWPSADCPSWTSRLTSMYLHGYGVSCRCL